MGEVTGIEWTDHTFNAWLGCEKVSPACTSCYAEVNRAVAAASQRVGKPLWGPGSARVVTSDSYWKQPIRWNREAEAEGVRRRVFCSSLADVFEDRADLDQHRARLFRLISDTPHLDWLLLTKRPDKIKALVLRAWRMEQWMAWLPAWVNEGRAPRNVWLGTTAEDQKRLDERAELLLQVAAVVHFLSGEPLLGPLELPRFISLGRPVCSDVVWIDDHKFVSPLGPPVAARAGIHRVHLNPHGARSVEVECGQCRGEGCSGDNPYPCRDGKVLLGIKPDECTDLGVGFGWVIVGGESGSSPRPMHPDWARSLRDQCAGADVPFFFKQWGEWVPREDLEGVFEGTASLPPSRGPRDERIRVVNHEGGHGFHGEGAMFMERVGKRRAGSLLDGVNHKAFPVVR